MVYIYNQEPPARQKYRVFRNEGQSIITYAQQMPLLIADKRVPITVAQVIEQRLNSQNPDWKKYFSTGDMIASHPNGNIKLVRDAQILREITPKTSLDDGTIMLADGVYETLEGAEFRRSDLVFEEGLDAEDAKVHPVWQFIARDGALLEEYVMFLKRESQFRCTKAMGLYLPSIPKSPKARALYIDWLENGSTLNGRIDLLSLFGRLVGVAPEIEEE